VESLSLKRLSSLVDSASMMNIQVNDCQWRTGIMISVTVTVLSPIPTSPVSHTERSRVPVTQLRLDSCQ
jgi:hypothetical protein